MLPVPPPAMICDVRDYGAKGDGITKDTVAIQRAIDACAPAGGTVRLVRGKFRSGMIRLRSRLTLDIEPSATLLGSQDPADYPDTDPPTQNSQLHNCRKALVYAEGVDHLVLTGGGTIDGNGDTPIWTGDGKLHPERTRPMAVYVALSTDVRVEGLTIANSAMWTLVHLESDQVVIRDVKIHSLQGPTRDGIDVVDCHHVLIENVTVASEDDSICLKSGSARGVEDVVVRDSKVLQSSVAQGLKLGTASTGHFTDVHFSNVAIGTVDKAAMAVESVDGAAVHDVTFDHVTFAKAGAAFFVLLGDRGAGGHVGTIDGVSFTHVSGRQTKHAWGSVVSGTAVGGVVHAPTNLTFEDVHVVAAGGRTSVPKAPPEYAGQYPDPNLWGDLPAAGLYLRHVGHVTLRDTAFTLAKPDARPPLATVDADVDVGSFTHEP